MSKPLGFSSKEPSEQDRNASIDLSKQPALNLEFWRIVDMIIFSGCWFPKSVESCLKVRTGAFLCAHESQRHKVEKLFRLLYFELLKLDHLTPFASFCCFHSCQPGRFFQFATHRHTHTKKTRSALSHQMS